MTGRSRAARLFALLAVATVSALASAATASAADLTVINTRDAGPGSLRQAISDSNANGEGDTITIRTTGTVELQTALPTVSNSVNGTDLSIVGPDMDRFFVSRDNSKAAFRIFDLDTESGVSISGLTVTGGRAVGMGGGIRARGDLELMEVRVTGNAVSGVASAPGRGGGIYSANELHLENVEVTDNTALNNAGEAALGGGVRSDNGPVTVTDSEISGNEALADAEAAGAGISAVSSDVTLTRVEVRDNDATGSYAWGAGLRSGGSLTIVDSVVDGNTATANATSTTFGGGIRHGGSEGPLTIRNSTVSNNALTNSGPSSSARGGGLYAGDDFLIQNSTVSGNTVSSGEGDGTGGGASFGSSSGPQELEHVTFADNGADAGDNLHVIYSPMVTIANTIIADGRNPGNESCLVDTSTGEITSQGHNLEDGDSCEFDAASDQVNADAGLAPLADHGGSTRTHAISLESDALDMGDNSSGGFASDQRGGGFDRTVDRAGVANASGGDGTDIGAFELQVTPEGPFGDASCSDGVDNDEDGSIDAADNDCDEPAPPPGSDGDGGTPPGNGGGDGAAPPPGGGGPAPVAPAGDGGGLVAGACANPFSLTGRGGVLRGTDRGDRLIGTDFDDTLLGYGGDDCLVGGARDDRLHGGLGDDRIDAGSGDDFLFGGSGDDGWLRGQHGDDRLSGGSGKDRLAGHAGRDRLSGGSGNDRLSGGRGLDSLRGGSGNDRLYGGSARDRLSGGGGRDYLSGGTGRDVLDGGKGRDRFKGGSGNDTIKARDGVRETVDCGKGRDRATVDREDRVRNCERVTRR